MLRMTASYDFGEGTGSEVAEPLPAPLPLLSK
jgi:hypothetical protein